MTDIVVTSRAGRRRTVWYIEGRPERHYDTVRQACRAAGDIARFERAASLHPEIRGPGGWSRLPVRNPLDKTVKLSPIAREMGVVLPEFRIVVRPAGVAA